MSQGKGIRKGHTIPSDHKKVPNSPDARCRVCGDEYVIVYQVHEQDATLAAQHAAYLSGYPQEQQAPPVQAKKQYLEDNNGRSVLCPARASAGDPDRRGKQHFIDESR